MWTSLFITLVLVLLSFLSPKSKFLYFLNFVWMWIQLSFCTDYSRFDYGNYVRRYISSDYDVNNSEVLYNLLNRFLLHCNFDFDTANAIMMFLTFGLTAMIIPRYTKKITCIAALFMLYPLYISGIQIRFFMASTIILFGLKYLLKGDNINLIKYCICCIIGMTIHSVAVFYLLFIIPRKLNGRRLVTFTLIVAASSFVLIKLFYGFFEQIFGEQRFESKVFETDNTIVDVMMAGIWQVSLLILMNWLRNVRLGEDKTYIARTSDMLIYNLSVFSITTIPLYFSDFSMERLPRSLLVVQFCYFMNLSEGILSKTMQIIKFGFLGWFVLTNLIFNVMYHERWTFLTQSYLSNNDVINNPENHLILLSVILTSIITYFIIQHKRIY